jgi:hypothetical protein
LLNKNFNDILSALSDAGAEFLIVGAHALAAHGYPRATGDLDIWIRPTADNADRVWLALERFGAPRRNLSREDLTIPDTVFQIGVAPQRIDLLTSIDGVSFDEAWEHRMPATIAQQPVAFLGRQQLLKNKRATGRPKDLADAIWLEAADDSPH